MGGVNLHGGYGTGKSFLDPYIVVGTTWKKEWCFFTKLTDGTVLWCQHVYKNYYVNYNTVKHIEIISKDEYLIRKLAGTLSKTIKLTGR